MRRLWQFVWGWRDRGFLIRNGHRLKWPLRRIPIEVYVSRRFVSPSGLQMASDACEAINAATGKRLLYRPTSAHSELERSVVMRPSHDWGCILVVPRTISDVVIDTPPHADIRSDDRNGLIHTVIVHVSIVDRPEIWLHEFCHALGLDHDAMPGSVMQPRAPEGTSLTRRDAARLRRAYG